MHLQQNKIDPQDLITAIPTHSMISSMHNGTSHMSSAIISSQCQAPPAPFIASDTSPPSGSPAIESPRLASPQDTSDTLTEHGLMPQFSEQYLDHSFESMFDSNYDLNLGFCFDSFLEEGQIPPPAAFDTEYSQTVEHSENGPYLDPSLFSPSDINVQQTPHTRLSEPPQPSASEGYPPPS